MTLSHSFTPNHQFFSSIFLSNKLLSRQSAKSLFVELGQISSFPDFLREINQGLDQVDLKIMHGWEQGVEMLVLVSTLANDDVSKTCSLYSPLELSFFKECIRVRMENEVHLEASSTALVNAGISLSPPLKGRDAEKLLARLLNDGWIIEE
jgi:hypothetical protein